MRRWARGGLILTTILVLGLFVRGSGAEEPKKLKTPLKPSAREVTRVPLTKLEVDPFGGEFSKWMTSTTITDPTPFLRFRWSTKEKNVASALWRVTDKPYGPGEKPHVYASGETKLNAIFSFDLRKFVPAKPPKEPYYLQYYVYVIPLDAKTKEERAPSSPVTITYRAPGPGTQFTDLVEYDEGAQAMLSHFSEKLKKKFQLEQCQKQGPPGTHGPNLRAFQLYDCPNGPVSIEVHSAPSAHPHEHDPAVAHPHPPTVFLGVPAVARYPEKVPGGGPNPAAYQWFEYTWDKSGNVTQPGVGTSPYPPRKDPSAPGAYKPPEWPYIADQFAPPDKPLPLLNNVKDWCHDHEYSPVSVVDDTHWSPILVGSGSTDGLYGLHHLFQSDPATSVGVSRGVVKTKDLDEWAMSKWTTVTLRGIVTSSDIAGGDFGTHHTCGYIGDDFSRVDIGMWYCFKPGADLRLGYDNDAPTPGCVDCPGIDWDMRVQADGAYRYLVSVVRDRKLDSDESVQVEIEEFAVRPDKFKPEVGEWVQVAGRWTVDCGHRDDIGDFKTEIHPFELLVRTLPPKGHVTKAHVLVTGAWLGGTTKFVVNPPARPSATSVLKYKVGEDWSKGAKLTIKAVPETNPNHLVGTITKTAGFKGPQRWDVGMVHMHNIGYKGTVVAWWDETLAKVKGRVMAGSTPARGAVVFYRDAAVANATWDVAVVDKAGNYEIPELPKNATYWLRPAGSGWNFDAVPRKVVIKSKEETVNFTAKPRAFPPKLTTLSKEAIASRIIGKPGVKPPAMEPVKPGAPRPAAATAQAQEMLRSLLLIVEGPSPSTTFGVKQNALGYTESGEVGVHLAGLAGWDNKPVPDLQSAYSVKKDDPSGIVINGYPTGGVTGAKIRAKLLLGDESVGYRVAQVAETQTDASGAAAFRFRAGGHVEHAVIEVEVLENPYNPWFRPKVSTPRYRFSPAKTGDDFAAEAKASYQLETIGKLSGYFAKEFLGELSEGRAARGMLQREAPKLRRHDLTWKKSPRQMKGLKQKVTE